MDSIPTNQTADYEKLEPSSNIVLDQHRQNASPSQKTAMPRWRAKGKEKSSIALACTWIVDHQISITMNILGLLFSTHIFFPQSRHHTRKFFTISYYNPDTGMFALGWDDIFFVFYWIVVFFGLRCAVMDYILTPLGGWFGIDKKKTKVRFAEQAWILLYYAMFWSTGMYIIYHSDYWLDLRALWRNWPVREMDGLNKWYYLVQFAFWLQQIVVVNIEERRKDHWQMFTHHIVTCALVFASYGYHQTKVGTLILCLLDVVDLFFPLAKILKYLNYRLSCDITFGVFMVTWFITRHIIYPWVCYSIWAHIPQEISYGCYKGNNSNLQGPFPTPNDWVHLTQPFRDPEGLVCWNNNVKWVFLGLLLALQCLLIGWFVMIVRVAYKVLSGQGADDSRSDDEDETEEEETVQDPDLSRVPQKVQLPSTNSTDTAVLSNMDSKSHVEKEILSTDANFSISPRSTGNSPSNVRSRRSSPVQQKSHRKDSSGNSSGINVLAASDRKELLGRIGCDKGSTSE